MIIDHGKVVYAEKEPGGGEVTVSSQGINTLTMTEADPIDLGIWSGSSFVQALERQR